MLCIATAGQNSLYGFEVFNQETGKSSDCTVTTDKNNNKTELNWSNKKKKKKNGENDMRQVKD